MEIWRLFGDLHPKLVQFPLVLLLCGLVFDALAVIWRSEKARWAGLACTGAGTIGMLFAFICGIYAEIWAGRAGVPEHPIELHELMANIASWGFVILFAWRILLTEKTQNAKLETQNRAQGPVASSRDEIENQKSKIKNAEEARSTYHSPKGMKAYLAVGFFWYGLLVLTGYLGGRLVFEYGAGASGLAGGTGMVLTVEDLNTLGSRQTDLNLRYSEWMHHIFGWMTLGLGVSLLAQALWPARRKHLTWIVPAFLLMGGMFLFFAADLDLYPRLTDWRQYRDREVQLHKTLAVVMVAVGAAGMAGKKKTQNSKLKKQNSIDERQKTKDESLEGGQLAVAGGQFHSGAPGGGGGAEGVNWQTDEAPVALEIKNQRSKLQNSSPPDSATRSNSKLVAVLALIGGSMLFTHVHTVAPYANVAAGVYIAHVVMGLVALSIGATRLGQDFVRRAGTKKVLAIAFAGFMLAEALLLITYNEGLPWYIGYGRYNRWGPLGDGDTSMTIAPFGDFRAAMYINQKEGKVFVGFRDRFTDDSVKLALDSAPVLLVSRGYEETAIPLAKGKPEGDAGGTVDAGEPLQGSNFWGAAEFLKTAELVSARLVLERNGKREAGYFDPWVTPLLPIVPPNEFSDYRYACPMHEYIRGKEAGEKCPLCGMEMIAIQAPRPAGVLHDQNYGFQVIPITPAAGKTGARFYLAPMGDGKTLGDLELVHGQPMHLIVVSADLRYFDHVHPVPVTDDPAKAGYYIWNYAFPRAGNYVLYADWTPHGDRNQVFRISLHVEADGSAVAGGAAAEQNHVLVDEAAGKLVETQAAPQTPQDPAPWKATDWDGAAGAPEDAVAGVQAGGAMKETVQAQMIAQPRNILAGLHTELVFTLRDAQGRPLTDLVPYIGAKGHCVIISEDTADYLHCHPEELLNPAPDEKSGPVVAFHAQFPRAGKYRVWGQFKRANGELIIAEYTVNVNNPPVPASLLRFLLDE